MSLQSEIWTAELLNRAKQKSESEDIPRWIELSIKPKQTKNGNSRKRNRKN